MGSKKYTVTSALPYANGPLHIGHIAGAYLPADIYVRYRRLKNDDVVFICGSDEHGAAITLRAKKEGISPKDIVDKYHELNKKTFEDFGISFDIFHRTSDSTHHQTAKDFFKILNQKGLFVKKTNEQFFDQKHQQFLADRYISGECPKCGYESAYGDQCEKCGSALSPQELINPKSTLSGETPILKPTTHWYLPMQNHEKWLSEWIEKGTIEGNYFHDPKKWRSQVNGQCMSWINNGLRERAMSRDLDWGVELPVKNSQGKVMYVWLDAPIGYISATKAWAIENDKNWEDYWKKDAELIHFIGKDNIVFHAIIFPILLKSHGEFVLPKNVPANEFLNLEGQKLSTSRNWAIWLHEYLKDFECQQDTLRYTLCATAPENKDTDFTWKDFQTRNNSELVGILGNFINRVVVLTNKYYNGIVPEKFDLDDYDKEVLSHLSNCGQKIGSFIENYKMRDGLFEAMSIARIGNKYLADTEPWKLRKTNERRTSTILNISLQIAASLTVYLQPFLPFTAQKLSKMLNVNFTSWDDLKTLDSSHKINDASLLFSKIEDDQIEIQRNKLSS